MERKVICEVEYDDEADQAVIGKAITYAEDMVDTREWKIIISIQKEKINHLKTQRSEK